jgi:hypothetical protein
METVLAYGVPFLAFLAIWAGLWLLAKRRGIQTMPASDARKWFALIVAFAAIAAVLGMLGLP